MTEDTKKRDGFMKSYEEAAAAHTGEGVMMVPGPFPKGTGKSSFGQQERMKVLMEEGGAIDMEAPFSTEDADSK